MTNTGFHYCNDAPERLRGVAKAEIVKEGQDQTDLTPPPDATVISRDAPIPVIRIERDVQFLGDGSVVAAEISEMHLNEFEHPERVPAALEMHPDASTSSPIGRGGDITVPMPEYGVGVLAVAKSDTHLGEGAVVNKPVSKIARTLATPSTPKQIPQAVPNQASTIVNTPRQPITSPQAAVGGGYAIEKIRVKLKSTRMGSHSIRVNKFSVSDSIIILGYIDDEDATIIEPPLTLDDGEDYITVTQGESSYKCRYYGFTSELTIDSFAMLLVVLVRIDQ